MRQFKSRVVANTETGDERMDYLEQYTTGEANTIVSGFGYLDASRGYPAALKELEDRYDNSEIIASAYIKRAMKWPSITASNAKGLDEYVMFLSECENAVKSIEAMKILDYPDTIKMLVSKLPYQLHERWRSRILSINERSDVVEFSDLVSVVKLEAKKAYDAVYAKDAMNADRDDNVRKNSRKNTQSSRSRGIYATTQPYWQREEGAAAHSPPTTNYNKNTANSYTHDNKCAKNAATRPCLFCGKTNHSMDACGGFSQQLIRKRLDFLKSHGFCFGCLKAGHQRRECCIKASRTKEGSDKDNGRGWYIPHHGVYHPKKPQKIRTVFDCSAKCQGMALNDLLLQGPDLTNNLVGVLLRFSNNGRYRSHVLSG
uniref:Uncharacterized protein LOC102805354 n=1 Tax=Saccoglossus kowalevskii TaxID=10224 RepID=A0ABM0MMC8_SACKO|nr:PREDICTED: uncharacterized protein LOC102805354 [Saccoglossus kowalevskii]